MHSSYTFHVESCRKIRAVEYPRCLSTESRDSLNLSAARRKINESLSCRCQRDLLRYWWCTWPPVVLLFQYDRPNLSSVSRHARVACSRLRLLVSFFLVSFEFTQAGWQISPPCWRGTSERTNSFAAWCQNQDYDSASGINLKFKRILPLAGRYPDRAPSPSSLTPLVKRRFHVNHGDMRVRPKFPANLEIKQPGRT